MPKGPTSQFIATGNKQKPLQLIHHAISARHTHSENTLEHPVRVALDMAVLNLFKAQELMRHPKCCMSEEMLAAGTVVSWELHPRP